MSLIFARPRAARRPVTGPVVGRVARLPTGGQAGLILAAGAVLAGLLLQPAVPLYDGVGFPDQPYRYVAAPAGVKHGPVPTPVSVSSPAAGGHNSEDLTVQSDEQGPQILVQVLSGLVDVPPAATTVTMRAVPLAPDRQPADGRIDGNVYRLSVSSDVGPARFGPGIGDSFLYLRAASIAPAPPVMEYRASGSAPWVDLKTGRGGTDVFVIPFKGAGDYALVHRRGARPAGGVSSETLLLVLVGGFVVLVLLAAVLARRPWRPSAGSDEA